MLKRMFIRLAALSVIGFIAVANPGKLDAAVEGCGYDCGDFDGFTACVPNTEDCEEEALTECYSLYPNEDCARACPELEAYCTESGCPVDQFRVHCAFSDEMH